MNSKSYKLAINGGSKTVDWKTSHYIWPPITEQTQKAVLNQLNESISIYNRSGIIETLENKFAQYHQVKYALLNNSGTSAIHSMFVGAGLTEEAEVLCPAYTFYATATPLFFTGAKPILVDCDSDGNINHSAIREKITNKTKAIIVTHIWGIPCNMDEIVEIAHEYDLMLFEDCSHAHGATYKGRKVGTFGDAAAFSLQGQKTVTAGEGGVLLTNSDEIYYRALMLGHYNKRPLQEIPKTHDLYRFAITGMGLKLRIHPLGAAIANEQLDRLDEILAGRRFIAQEMIREFQGLPCIEVPKIADEVQPTWYAFIMQYHPEVLGNLSLKRFYEALKAEGCTELDLPGSTCPLNYHPLFQDPSQLFPHYAANSIPASFPEAEAFYQGALKLPVWHDFKDLELVRLYAQAFRKVIENYRELLNNEPDIHG